LPEFEVDGIFASLDESSIDSSEPPARVEERPASRRWRLAVDNGPTCPPLALMI
jgi:hypothetical protein